MAGNGVPTRHIAVPYRLDVGPIERHTLYLDEVAKHPMWLARPYEEGEARVIAAQYLTHRDFLRWEVWRGGDPVGILLLSRIVPGVDALLHFMFLDHNLVGKRQLLKRFLGMCFQDLGFRRLSMEVPEFAEKYLRFVRKLGFRFEGEDRADGLTPTAFLEAGAPGLPPVHHASRWIAKHGARREGCHWYNNQWHDVLCLRLMAHEWDDPHAE